MNDLPQYNWGAEKHRWFGVSFYLCERKRNHNRRNMKRFTEYFENILGSQEKSVE
jgi:hypothetical protein